MNVLFLAPGFPAEMPLFTAALSEVGARVIGAGDQPEHALPPLCRHHLSAYFQVPLLGDEAAAVRALTARLRRVSIHRVETLWEPLMLLAARLREALGVPGATVAETLPLRDKERMKQVLDAAGLRTPHHASATRIAEVCKAAEAIGFPLILKPIAGAGSADTYRVDTPAELEGILPRLRHVPEVSVEEFIDGEEYTFDTITVGGRIAFHNIAWYRPRPLIARTHEWISPQVVALRDVDAPELAGGVALGEAVIEALGFQTGFTHMEWYRKADGEVVFGEIGGRPPGARQVDQMNWACDIDTFRGWASAVCHGRFEEKVERRYNVATVFKRAKGSGIIRHIEGIDGILRRFGEHIVYNELLPVGAHRRDWKQTLISDGFVILRHPDLNTTLEMADALGTDLTLYAS